ncbi:OLC1v1013475C1 [Oldenlandia corymbosa var. corymbosa]|uniref:OLC1v1013475C1 n=1 Tax=Oldenlandia corymbosa var. corymbosa TaxID=529605 RepID=A0AAV1E1L7_OLDCO|nr:OLC1v1013475C1 [Oldenlandia corymbosa var. corymbosa]
MKIVEMCNGLPLTIILVAGILRSMEPNDWKRVIDSVNRGNQQVLVKSLLALWMVEGFIRKVETKRLSDVAGEYLNDLIGRSLLMVSKVTSTGRVKRCRVHDLLHEFCSQKTKEEQFFHFLERGYDELSGFNEPPYLRRLCVRSSAEDFIESNVFCPRVRSLRFKYSQHHVSQSFTLMMHICKRLRVLDLEQIHLHDGIPCEIGELVGFAYLAIGGSVREIPQSTEMPSCFGNIQTLQLIEVTPTVTDLVKKIEEVQTDSGNSDLKIIIFMEHSCGDNKVVLKGL